MLSSHALISVDDDTFFSLINKGGTNKEGFSFYRCPLVILLLDLYIYIPEHIALHNVLISR